MDTGLVQGATRVADIIWNMTLVCPWDCAMCCVDAVHVTGQDGAVRVAHAGLKQIAVLERDTGGGSIFDRALRWRQERGEELTLEQKLRVLDHLVGFRIKLDISGGDPLSVSENLIVLESAAARFGRKAITVTATGAGLSGHRPEDVAALIGEYNFTYDSPSTDANANRPDAYAAGNLRKAAALAAAGIPTRAECPLSTENVSERELRRLYEELHTAGIQKLHVMRLFPSGRGARTAETIPTREQYQRAVAVLEDAMAEFGSPKVTVQCSLRQLVATDLTINPCDAVRESFGLMADGRLLASPWAIDERGQPLDDAWLLGNLADHPLEDILAGPKAEFFRRHVDDNFGHCKIFAYTASDEPNPLSRIFDTTDPLYVA